MQPRIGLRLASGLLVLAATSVLAVGRLGAPSAHAAGNTPDLAIAVDVNGGGDDCDTRASTSGIGTTCNVLIGGMFTVKGHVDGINGLTDGNLNLQMGYIAVQFRLLHSAGLTLNNAVMGNPDNELGFPTPYWSGCTAGSMRSESQAAGQYDINCFTTGAEDTTAPDKIIEVDYTCATAGMQTVTMEDNSTYVHNDLHGNTPLDKEANETLIINCTAPVGGITHLSGVDGSTTAPLAQRDSSNSEAWLIATLAAGILAVLTGAAVFAWRRSLR